MTDWIGVALLGHFVLLIAIKIHLGLQEEIWWLSHVAVAVTGMGLLIRSRALIGAMLICVAVPHTLWLIDMFLLGTTGESPWYITAYLTDAGALLWIGTLHHFYLLPLLLTMQRRWGRLSGDALALAAILYLALLIGGRGLSMASNVNYAHAILPGVDFNVLRWVNTQTAMTYLAIVYAWMVVVFFTPTAVLVYIWTSIVERAACQQSSA